MLFIYIQNIFFNVYYSLISLLCFFFLMDNYIETIFYIFIKIFLNFNTFLFINDFCKNQIKIIELNNILDFLLINFMILYFITIFIIYMLIYSIGVLKKIKLLFVFKLFVYGFVIIINYLHNLFDFC